MRLHETAGKTVSVSVQFRSPYFFGIWTSDMPLSSLYVGLGDGFYISGSESEDSDAGSHRSRSRSPPGGIHRRLAFDAAKQVGLRWAEHNCSSLGIDMQVLQSPLDKPLSITTACSCSGAPTHALDQLITRSNYCEVWAAEIHALGICSLRVHVAFISAICKQPVSKTN